MGILSVPGEKEQWVCDKNLHVLNVRSVAHHDVFSKVMTGPP